MSATLTELTEVLERETEQNGQLLEEAERKRTAVIEGDLDTLETILRREQALIAEVEAAEARRQPLAEAACRQLGLGAPVKMARIIDKAPAPHAERLADVRARLRGVLDQLRFRTEQNANLLQASIRHVDGFLHMVAETSAPDPVYGRDGRRRAGEFSLLDRSA
jgi:flagellar biosynthesis/type III secretory pathway chaperone